MEENTRIIDGAKIRSFDAFHAEFKEALGFPEFYGNNMNAWIDCMSDIHDNTQMSNVYLGADQPLNLVILNASVFSQACPDALIALIEDTAFVNSERLHDQAPIHLIFRR